MRRAVVVGVAMSAVIPAMLAGPSIADQDQGQGQRHGPAAAGGRGDASAEKGLAPPGDRVFYFTKRELKRWAMGRDSRSTRNGYLPSQRECTAQGRPDNLLLDCDDKRFWTPNDEPHIVVDPEDP